MTHNRPSSWTAGLSRLAARAVELQLLLPLTACLALLWALMKMTGEVLEGDTRGLDLWILSQLRRPDLSPAGPAWLLDVARDLTSLGGPSVLVLVTLGVGLGLWVADRHRMAAMVGGSALGGLALTMVFKELMGRSRPDAAYHLMAAWGPSFPSGHAMMSAVVYLTIAALLARLTSRPALRLCLVGMAAALSGIVGLTRIYLGVHWASDVVAAWLAGALWAGLAWSLSVWTEPAARPATVAPRA